MFNIKKLLKNKFVMYGVLPAIVIFGLIAFWLYRDMVFSKEVVRLELLGPQLAAMGQEVEYKVTYKNNGNIALESPRLTILLPGNSLTEDGKERLTQEVDDIYPGQEKVVKFKVRLLGKEDETKTVRAIFSYIPHNLSARYESETTFTTRINEVPITLTYDAPLKVEQGKEISYAVNYFSGVDYPLENLTIRLESVPGFTVKSSDPASLDTNAFDLDVLQKGQGGRITIKGVIGEAASPLRLVAKLGMWVDGVFVIVKEVEHEIEVEKDPAAQVNAKLEILQKAAHNEAAYQITWQVKNDVNDVNNVKIKAQLPEGVTLNDVLMPESEADHFSFDNKSREVVWVAGSVPAGTGITSAPRTLIFEVSTQGGTGSMLVGQATISGEDQFTGQVISSSAPPVVSQ